MKKRDSAYVIGCVPEFGPVFCDGEKYGADILIGDKCNREDSCLIENDGKKGYECHPIYKSSLFVNSARRNDPNSFSVSDYEVFACNEDIEEEEQEAFFDLFDDISSISDISLISDDEDSIVREDFL